jgi:hypothetical protein
VKKAERHRLLYKIEDAVKFLSLVFLFAQVAPIYSRGANLLLVASRVGLKNDVEVSLLLRDRETVERGIQILPFYQNIIAEGVDIYMMR